MATVHFGKRNKPTTIIIVSCLGPPTHMCSSGPDAHSGGGHAIRRSRYAITGKRTNYGRDESWRQTLARASTRPETKARSQRRRRSARWSWATISWTIAACRSSRLRCRKRAWRRSKPMTHNYTHTQPIAQRTSTEQTRNKSGCCAGNTNKTESSIKAAGMES